MLERFKKLINEKLEKVEMLNNLSNWEDANEKLKEVKRLYLNMKANGILTHDEKNAIEDLFEMKFDYLFSLFLEIESV